MIKKYIALTIILILNFGEISFAGGIFCKDLDINLVERNQQTYSSYLDELIKSIEAHPQIIGKRHPRSLVAHDDNKLGLLEAKLSQIFPAYQTAKNILSKIERNSSSITLSSFYRLVNHVYRQYQMDIKTQTDANYFFAVLDTAKVLKEISLKIEEKERQRQAEEDRIKEEQREKEQEQNEANKEDQKDKQDNQNQQNQPSQQNQQQQKGQQSQQKSKSSQQQQKKSQEQNDKDKKEESSEEDDNAPEPKLDEDSNDQYKTENKDLQGSKGKNKKPFYGIITSAPAYKRLLPADIYDDFDTNGNLIKRVDLRNSGKQVAIDINKLKYPDFEFIKLNNKQGSAKLVINVPYGYEPVLSNYSGEFTVQEIRPEEYQVISKNGGKMPAEIHLWLTKKSSRPLTNTQIRGLTKKSGIKLSEWPDHIHMGIAQAKGHTGAGSKQIVESLSHWFQKEGPYLYNSRTESKAEEFDQVQENLKNKSGTVPFVLAIAQEKMFNCDGAALIGATILRDVFHLPTRIVGGRTVSGSKKDEHGNVLNYVDLNDPRHAWVEVFIDGQWVPFDFTPLKNSPEGGSPKKDKLDKAKESNSDNEQDKQDKQNEQQEQQDQQGSGEGEENSDDNEQQEESNENAENSNSSNGQGKGAGKGGDQGNLTDRGSRTSGQNIDKNAAKKKARDKSKGDQKDDSEQRDQSKADQSEQSGTSGVGDKDAESQAKPEDVSSDLIAEQKLKEENDKVKKLPKDDENLRDIFDLPKSYDSPIGVYALHSLNKALQSFVKKGPTEAVRLLFDGLISLVKENRYSVKARLQLNSVLDNFYRENDKSISDLLVDAKNAIYKDPNLVYQRLKLITLYYKSLSNIKVTSVEQTEFIRKAESILSQLAQFKHKNSAQQDLIERLIKNLPGDITKSLILNQHKDALQIGSADQGVLFSEILAGKWAGAYQASLVNKHFNFFLNSEKVYQVRRAQTLLRAYQREKRSEGLVLAGIQDVANFQSWVFDPEFNQDPALTFLAKLLKDEQYMMGYRQMFDMPGKASTLERKHTNIFYDISGSMNGSKAVIQASVIAALVDRALSEKDPFGKPLHSVMIFPFGGSVGDGVLVENVEQARLVINNFLNNATPAGSSTDIQACFDKHFQIIHEFASKEKRKQGGVSDLPLKHANMILISDGADTVSAEKVIADLNNLPEGVKTFFNLAILEGENPSLERIVAATNSAKAKSMITKLSGDQIESFIKEAANPTVDPEAFVYDNKMGRVEGSLAQQILALTLPNTDENVDIVHINQLKQSIRGVSGIELSPRVFILTEIQMLTELFNSGLVEYKQKQLILGLILSRFHLWSNHNLNQLNYLEEEKLRELIAAADKST
jgi:hypothetical protein